MARMVSSDSSGISVSDGNAVLKGSSKNCWHYGQTNPDKKTMAGLPALASSDMPWFLPMTSSGRSRLLIVS